MKLPTPKRVICTSFGGDGLRRRAAAFIGNADDLGVPLVVQPAQEQIGERAFAERRVVQPARLRLRQRLQFGDGIDAEARRHEHAFDQPEQPRHRREILVGVVGQIAEQQRIVGHRRVIDDADGVAVGRRLRAGLPGDDAGGAAEIFHHHRLAELLLQAPRRGAHDDVGDTSGSNGHDHLDRPARISVGARRERRTQTGQQTDCECL